MNNLELGKWNVVCDRCGLQYKNTELRDEWTGLKVCSPCWEPRHPQTLLRPPAEDSAIPWSRPEPEDVYVRIEDPLLTELLQTILTENELILYSS